MKVLGVAAALAAGAALAAIGGAVYGIVKLREELAGTADLTKDETQALGKFNQELARTRQAIINLDNKKFADMFGEAAEKARQAADETGAKTTEAATTSARPPQAPPIPVPAVAPDKQGFTEPEFEGVFFRLVAGNLVALERAPLKASVVALTVKRAWDIAGGTSPVRFRAGEEVEFVVRARNATADPTFAYDLRKLVTKRAVREVKACFRGRYAEPQVFDCPFFLPLRFSRYGSSSYKITTQALPPGEYALRRTNAESVFCFGVD